MAIWIALLRGINVGGKNSLPMKDLREHLTAEGLGKVKTYIQSGNCVFESSMQTPKAIEVLIADTVDRISEFRPRVLVISAATFRAAIDANPFPEATNDPKSLHFYFLDAPAQSADIDALLALKKDSETFRLTDQVFYLHASEGIGRSKLAERAEKLLGVATTARNLRSVLKIAELID